MPPEGVRCPLRGSGAPLEDSQVFLYGFHGLDLLWKGVIWLLRDVFWPLRGVIWLLNGVRWLCRVSKLHSRDPTPRLLPPDITPW